MRFKTIHFQVIFKILSSTLEWHTFPGYWLHQKWRIIFQLLHEELKLNPPWFVSATTNYNVICEWNIFFGVIMIAKKLENGLMKNWFTTKSRYLMKPFKNNKFVLNEAFYFLYSSLPTPLIFWCITKINNKKTKKI